MNRLSVYEPVDSCQRNSLSVDDFRGLIKETDLPDLPDLPDLADLNVVDFWPFDLVSVDNVRWWSPDFKFPVENSRTIFLESEDRRDR